MIENEALQNPYGFLLEPSDWPKRLVTSFGFFLKMLGPQKRHYSVSEISQNPYQLD